MVKNNKGFFFKRPMRLIVDGSRSITASASCCVYWGSYQGEGQWLWMLVLVTCDRWNATRVTWHMTHDIWHLTPDTWNLKYNILFDSPTQLQTAGDEKRKLPAANVNVKSFRLSAISWELCQREGGGDSAQIPIYIFYTSKRAKN